MAESVASISGLASGIDWTTTIEQLMAIEARPVNLLEERKSDYETKLSMWNQLNTKLLSLESAAKNLTNKDDFASRIATTSDSDVVTASATGSASPGTHIISSITSLARANNYVSGSGYASADSNFGQAAGSFVINLANHPDGAQSITLAYGTDYTSATTLDEFANLINNHPDNEDLVTASIVNDGSGATPYRLVITASNTGTDYSITSITDTSTGLAMAQGLTASDLVFNIDSINITKSSNQVSDVIPGVTLNFIDYGITSDLTINVENDKATIKSNINSMVNAYNDVKSFINMISSYDEENETMGPLLGDGNLSSVRSKLAAIIAGAVQGLSSSSTYNSLSQIGIKSSADTGLLFISNSKLDDALDEDFDAVADVFCEKSGSDNSTISYIQRSNKTQAGSYSVVVNYNGSGQMTSATINGEAANILGTLVQGASGTDAEGLLLKFTWPGSGSQQTANVNLSLGVNCQLEVETEYITSKEYQEGEVYWATDSLQDSIDDLDEQINAMERRLEETQARYERQFNQLEVVISQMRSQSSYLASILSQ